MVTRSLIGLLKKFSSSILPKQPTNFQASFRITQLVKRQALDREVVFSDFYSYFQRKSTCVLFRSQKQPTNLLLYLAWGGQKKTKISPRGKTTIICLTVSLKQHGITCLAFRVALDGSAAGDDQNEGAQAPAGVQCI